MVMSIEPMEKIPLFYNYNRSNSHKLPRQRHRVIAAAYLPTDVSTEIIKDVDLQENNVPVVHYINVAHRDGRLYCVDSPVNASYWLKLITIANDVHSENVVLVKTSDGVYLKTIKLIHPGEPLMMWFNLQLLEIMNIPIYLSPVNMVQKDNSYRCHICDRLFAYPNPLKMHLALDCGKLDQSYLWNKLVNKYLKFPLDKFRIELPREFEYQMLSMQHQTKKSLHSIDMKHPRVKPSLRHYTPTSTSSFSIAEIPSTTPVTDAPSSSSEQTSPNTSINLSLEIPKSPATLDNVALNSAFKPYPSNHNLTMTDTRTHDLIPRSDLPFDYPHPLNALFQASLRSSVPMPNVTNEAQAAEMETFISNLGRSKEGHYCIWCRKVYSRKYGLKIHLRTHTGFKPLKCKVCLRPFGDPSNLNKHVRLHAEGGETPYKCDLCGKVLVRRRDLERHIKSRHQDNEYASSPSPRQSLLDA
ncbi:sal-like protein 1 [Microplitis demolitor]|uniref:sal-like protein 1 n=1 Tax=Microplitis demolitor TaxID=69319 RepID=UPI0004CD646A|nr:sal-like protein 1 [Microplitis demolitor]